MTRKNRVFQFKITLKGTTPPIWRRLQVEDAYTFWDLHVAIQDVMGWDDAHLHVFRVVNPDTRQQDMIGIPDDLPRRHAPATLSGWEIPLAAYFLEPGAQADYEYDFGDGWEHQVILEEIASGAADTPYPLCVAGERACPPEDCGGIPGYSELLEVLGDPAHEEHNAMLGWLGGSFAPEVFDPRAVHFDDPQERWKLAFEQE